MAKEKIQAVEVRRQDPASLALRRQVGFWLIAAAVVALFVYVFSDILLPFVAGLALAYFLYLDRTDWGGFLQWLFGIMLLVGVLAQSGGFFLHLTAGAPERTTAGTTLTRAGALLIAAALIALAIGLIQTL